MMWHTKHRWLGHVLRHDNLLLHDIIEGKTLGKATRGTKRMESLLLAMFFRHYGPPTMSRWWSLLSANDPVWCQLNIGSLWLCWFGWKMKILWFIVQIPMLHSSCKDAFCYEICVMASFNKVMQSIVSNFIFIALTVFCDPEHSVFPLTCETWTLHQLEL